MNHFSLKVEKGENWWKDIQVLSYLNVIFQCLNENKQNSIHSCCIAAAAEISAEDLSKPAQIKRTFSAWG